MEVKGPDVALAEAGSLLPLPRVWNLLPKFQLTFNYPSVLKVKLFRLKIILFWGHMLYAELLALYIVLKMENFIRA